MSVRLHTLLFFLIFLFFLVVCRLFYWQIVRAEELSDMGAAQYDAFVKVPATRGEIRTSDGFPIATNKISYLLFAQPKEIKDKEKTSILLASALETDKASISAILASDKLWVPIQAGLNNTKKEAIEKLALRGIGFDQHSVRFYPEASMAATLIGFVGKDSLGEDKGYFGLEGFYDRQLRGKVGSAIQVRDALGKPIISKTAATTKAIDGRSLVLSIDRAVQFMVETKLKEGIEKYQAAGGMVGIIEPKTGNVIALATYPSFDQRNFQEYAPELYRNPFVSNLFEPGSTFKALVMAAGLDAKVVTPATQCPVCTKPLEISGYTIKTWNDTYHKNISMIDVIRYSDNTGMVYVQRSLGLERMLSYLYKFGIGDLTNIDLQGEVAPAWHERETWYELDAATASFGQGITVTPIELLTGFAAIANEGNRMEPHIVTKIETPDGETISIQPKIVEKPITSATAKVMTEILVNAVSNGEAKWAKPKGYRIAGKTGTAQIPIAGHYDPNKTIASFIGFAPADNPKFAMLVIVDRPVTSIYGSETAAPIFFDIAKDLLTYYNIPPTE